MNRYCINIEIPAGKVDEILKRLEQAQEEIRDCYDELVRLGVVSIKEDTASGN